MTTTTKPCDGPGCTAEVEPLRPADQPPADWTFCSQACLAAYVVARLGPVARHRKAS